MVMRLEKFLGEAATEQKWGPRMLELSWSEPSAALVAAAEHLGDARWPGWKQPFSRFVRDTVLPGLTGSSGDTAAKLELAVRQQPPANPALPAGTVDDFVSALTALPKVSPGYGRATSGPHAFFVERSDDHVCLYQSPMGKAPLASSLPARVFLLKDFCGLMRAALQPHAGAQPPASQRIAQRTLFHGHDFPVGLFGGRVIPTEALADDDGLRDNLRAAIDQHAAEWNRWMNRPTSVAALFESTFPAHWVPPSRNG
ncbi:hypothetical protein JYJ95_09325 [Corallococcus exiguus]|uniref:hypothetical protein n=1 Tax=Corallococcus exiguus TaxID=83462 RepID=UPI001A8CFE45|nr:hypothetical protein [Corallococcus exiguus]MBN8466715.1 hypothetical protein [Corallococcus exiguus]